MAKTTQEKQVVTKFRAKEKLVHKFTEQELIELGQRLTSKMDILEANEDLKKEAMADWKSRIESNEAAIQEVKHRLQAGEEEQDVDVEISYNDPENGWKTCRRMDTQEEVWKREMTEKELQLEFPFPDGKDYTVSGTGEEDDPFTFTPVDEA